MEGFDYANEEPFCYVSQKVVIATGCTSKPNHLNIPGEMTKNHRIVHDFGAVEELILKLKEEAEREQRGKF